MSEDNPYQGYHAQLLEKLERLERENAALRQALADMPTCRCGLSTDEQCALSVQNAALRKDKERLDWLETQDCWIGVYGEYDINARICAGGSHSQRIRSAIDAARKEAQQ